MILRGKITSSPSVNYGFDEKGFGLKLYKNKSKTTGGQGGCLGGCLLCFPFTVPMAQGARMRAIANKKRRAKEGESGNGMVEVKVND